MKTYIIKPIKVTKYVFGNKDTYPYYEGYKKERKLTELEYVNLLADIIILLTKWLFRNPGQDFVLPHTMGGFGLRKGYTKFADKDSIVEPKLNLSLTKKYKKPIYFLNDHTRGEYFKLAWIKPGLAYFKNISAYKIHSLYNLGQAIKDYTKSGMPSKKIIQQL